MTTLFITLLAVTFIIVYLNGYFYGEFQASDYEGTYFFQKWNQYVDDTVGGKTGRFSMKFICFVPTVIAFFSWCRAKICPAKDEDLC